MGIRYSEAGTKHAASNFYTFIFSADDNLHSTTRTVYNLVDVLSETGGFASVITLFFTLLTMRVQKALYF